MPLPLDLRDQIVRTRHFMYCHVNYCQRRMELLSDGTVGTGPGQELRWSVAGDTLRLEDDQDVRWMLQPRLHGAFDGVSLRDERARLVLAPAARPSPPANIEIRNGLEIRVFGQKRSGHHAIIGWLGSQFSGETYFFNDCCPFADPFRTHVNTLPFIARYPAFANHGSVGRSQFEPFAETAGAEAERAERLRSVRKKTLIFSFEDFNLECHEGHIVFPMDVGNSARRVNLLVLRDPFNLVASVVHDRGGDTTNWKYAGILATWKQYAKEALGETTCLPDRTCLLYNQWFTDRQYRDRIAERSGTINSDCGLLRVPPNGRGSSFDGLAFDGQAQAMDVLNRWRTFAEDDRFWSLFADSECQRLTRALFPEMAEGCCQFIR